MKEWIIVALALIGLAVFLVADVLIFVWLFGG